MALKDSASKRAMSRKRQSVVADRGDKTKKPGFFDLGSFVAKVKARDVNILNGEFRYTQWDRLIIIISNISQ